MSHKLFPAELDNLYDMLDFIKGYGASHQVPTSNLDQIILATEEALVNIINYGYPNQKKGTIDITCKKTPKRPGIQIVIKDQGIPFNPVEKVPTHPPSPDEILNKANDSLGGYGIYILVGLMDRVEYKRFEEGNILALTKYFAE